MQQNKTASVAIIYNCARLSEKIIRNRTKLCRRLQYAIKEMVEDGFTNFILPIEHETPFPTSVIDAINIERANNPNIQLTIMLPYKLEKVGSVPSAELQHNYHYTIYADQIIYNEKIRNNQSKTNLIRNLLSIANAVITYYEQDCYTISNVMQHILIRGLRHTNINI